ncbi:MAG: UTP--glucose-1-phosphate uridylyltransferase [Candidatus Limnocylindria bacterium]
MKPVRTAVIPAGGLGTRFLPFSRSVPKELLPLVDTPVIDLVVSECAASGVERVIIVGAPGKESLLSYFRPNERLARRLEAEGRHGELGALRRPERLAEVTLVVQEEPKGNGHAVLVARDAVGDEPFVMLWGDDIVVGGDPAAGQLIAARERLSGGSVAAAIRVPWRDTSRYGILAGDRIDERTIRVRSIVEKPPEGEAPSDLASVHGYLLEPAIFDVLEDLSPGKSGEVWLSDAVSRLSTRTPVWGLELSGRRYDTGDRGGYVQAFVDQALAREDTGPGLRAHLVDRGWRPPDL